MPSDQPNQSQSGTKRSAALSGLVRAQRLLEIAFILPISVCIGLALGYVLDRWLHQHWIEVVGMILGAVAGFIEVFHIVQQNEKDSQ